MRTLRCIRRTGTALLTVMIVLMIVSMLLLGSLHTFATAARHQRTADQQLQARWLATSALSRAVAQLQRNPNYQGEIWNLSTAEVFGAATEPMADASPTARPRATITIEIEAGCVRRVD